MSRLTELAIAKRSVTLLLAVGLFIAGISAWGSLKQELLPDINFPVITVIAPYPGVGASDVANQVTKPIEHSISSVPRLSAMSSSSANSIAIVVAQFQFGTDVKEARSTIEQNLQAAGLPKAVVPQVSALNINASPVIIASVAGTSADGLDAAAQVARTQVAPALQGIDGVATVDLTGGLQNQLLVTLDPAKLTATGISVAQVTGILTANNLTVPSGQITTGGTNIPVSTIGTFTSVAQVENLVVGAKLPAGAAPGAGTGTGATPGATPSATPGATPRSRRAWLDPRRGAPDPHLPQGHRHGRRGGRPHDRLCAHRRRPVRHRHRDQDVDRQHRRGGRRGHRGAGEDRRREPEHRQDHRDLGPVDLHQGVP